MKEYVLNEKLFKLVSILITSFFVGYAAHTVGVDYIDAPKFWVCFYWGNISINTLGSWLILRAFIIIPKIRLLLLLTAIFVVICYIIQVLLIFKIAINEYLWGVFVLSYATLVLIMNKYGKF